MRLTDLPSVGEWWHNVTANAAHTVHTVLSQHTPGARLALTLTVVALAALAGAAARRLGTDPEAPFDLEA